MRAITTTTRPPAAPSGFWTTKCRTTARFKDLRIAWSATGRAGWETLAMAAPSAVVADTRVEPPVGDVHDQVGERKDDDHQHHQGLRHGVVVVRDGLDKQLAEPVEIEHLLRHDKAAHEKSELDADDGNDRQQRVAERVAA